jgi:YidC/Oxa1 family membrane protein insertase
MGSIFHVLFEIVGFLLAAFYMPFHNYLIAIVLLTVFIMTITYPLTAKQTRSMIAMNQLQPEIKRLQELHKDDKQKATEEIMALYKKHHINPLGGCLPLLLQYPLLIVMLKVLEGLTHVIYPVGMSNGISDVTNVLSHGTAIPVHAAPKYISHSTALYHDLVQAGGHMYVWGFDLASKAIDQALLTLHTVPFVILIGMSAATQLIATKQIYARNKKMMQNNAQSKQMMKMQYFLVIFLAWIGLRFEAAVLVYWVVSGFIRVFQQWAMYKYDRKLVALIDNMSVDIEADIEHDSKEKRASKRTTPPKRISGRGQKGKRR